MTQADLAARLGEYQSFVARLESGQRRIDVVEFLELADAVGLDPTRTISTLPTTAANPSKAHFCGSVKEGG